MTLAQHLANDSPYPLIQECDYIPANTKTRPNVVSMLVQRRWRWANIETALGQILAFAGMDSGC